MDGRVQMPVNAFLCERFGVNAVDTITEPGPNGILARGDDRAIIENLMLRLKISVEKHRSVGIAVVGHHDCAGNPVDGTQQSADTLAAAEALRSAVGDLPVIGLWVDENWRVSEL